MMNMIRALGAGIVAYNGTHVIDLLIPPRGSLDTPGFYITMLCIGAVIVVFAHE
jgi:hypothetical protein